MVLSLVQALSYLPIAIVQAASSINLARQSVKTYLELPEEPEPEIIQLPSEDRLLRTRQRYADAKNASATVRLISSEHIYRHIRSPRRSCRAWHAFMHRTFHPRSYRTMARRGGRQGCGRIERIFFRHCAGSQQRHKTFAEVVRSTPTISRSGSTRAAVRWIVFFTEQHLYNANGTEFSDTRSHEQSYMDDVPTACSEPV